MNRSVALVIPIYNEADTLDALFTRLRALQRNEPRVTEIVFVDDGSTDRSADRLAAAAADETTWRLIQLSRNFGQAAAVLAGLERIDVDGVVVMDGDLQDPPEVVSRLISKWDEGYEVVYAIRRSRAGESLFKRLSSTMFYRLLQRLSDVAIPVDTGDFRLMDRKVVDTLRGLREQHPYIRGLVAWTGFRQTGITFDRASRAAGKTHYNFTRMLALSLDALVSFSPTPLRLVIRLGVITVVFALLYCFVVLGLWMAGINVPGWTSMMLIILFLSSVQLISLGVIGEYVARIALEVKGRPRYIIAHDSGVPGERRDASKRSAAS